MFIIDGYDYDGDVIVDGVTESGSLIYGESMVTTQSGRNWYSVIGTTLGHTVVIRRNPNVTITEWDALWDVITEPVEYHSVTMPHNQTTVTYDAHISTFTRAFIRKDGTKNIWGDYTITLEPIEPQRRA